MNAKKLISILLCVCMMMGLLVVAAQAANPTITFDSKSKRTSYSVTQQVWAENGITVTNDKASSTTNVGDYANPARFYKGSSLTVAYTQNIEKVIFTCTTYQDKDYPADLKASITSGTVTVDGLVVTVTLATPATSYTINKLAGQVRIASIEVVAGEGSNPGGGTPDPDPTPVAPSDPKEIVDAAFALEPGKALPYEATLTGKIISVDDPFNSQFNNVTVTIEVEGTTGTKALKCYRIKGEGADVIAVGDTITVKGTIKNYVHTSTGNSEIEFDAGSQLVSYTKGDVAPETPDIDADVKAILDAAYALADGEQLPEEVSLTGKVIKIDTPYNEQYKNISVTIEIPGAADKPILCYRLGGEDVAQIALGDTITVTGIIKNYGGTIEFIAGCSLDDRIPGENEAPVAPTDPKEIVDAAFALEKGASLPYMATLTGTITEIVTLYDEQYKNITVNIEVEGTDGKKIIECYRLKGEGAENLAVGDVIAVTGQLTRYYKAATEDKPELDKIEFTSGCTFVPATIEGGDDTTGDDTTGDDTTDDNTNQPPQTSDMTMIAVMIVAILSATSVAVLVIGKKKLF